jgi:putative ABC transport system permease protein
MRGLRAFCMRLLGVLRPGSREQDLSDEIEGNIALIVEEHVRAGMDPKEARRRASLEFGNPELMKQACRERLGVPFLEMFLYDLRYAMRSLSKSPVFTVFTVATLSFGIGASTIMFTVAQAILLRSLPYHQPDRLVAISEVDRLRPALGSNVASADSQEWRRTSTVFSGTADYLGIDERGKDRFQLYLERSGQTRVLDALAVDNNIFNVLGVVPFLGRNLAPGEDHVVILSFDAWQSVFAGAPNIVGRTVTLSGVARDVVGVMPRGFFFPIPDIQVYIPTGPYEPNRIFHDEGVVGRLKPGITLDEARAEMATIGARLQHEFPKTNANLMPEVDLLHAEFASTSRPAVLMLLSAVAILFVIVCSNVAHLQLGRSASRFQEFSIRKALGASRSRLVAQLLTESMLLSATGGVLGLAVTAVARIAILHFAAQAIPSYADVRVDTWVILFNVVITLTAPLLFAVGPAWSTARPDIPRARGTSSQRSLGRTRGWLVGTEVALSVMLVVCAGLLIHSFVRLEGTRLGFQPSRILTFRLQLRDFTPDGPERSQQITEIEQRLLQQNGIEAVGATLRPVLGGGSGGEDSIVINGREQPLRLEIVTPGYFAVMQTPLLKGRFPGTGDTNQKPLVVAVNQAFERAYFPDGDILGRKIGFGSRGPAAVVGVVADIKQEAVAQPAQPAAFVPSSQIPLSAATFMVRSHLDRKSMETVARSVVYSVNPRVPLEDIATLNDLVRESVSVQRIRATVLSLVAMAALLLAALGLYGVLAYSVAQRTTEIGIRMALGAPALRLFRLIVSDGLRPAFFGGLVGFAAAYFASLLIRSQLFDTVPADASTYLLSGIVLALTSVAACIIPALKAIRVHPMMALRQQ